MKDLVLKSEKGNPITTSLLVAEKFEKEHNKVCRDIENLSCSDSFRAANFGETLYIHPQNGQTYRMYVMTKDGFTFLVMGYTGDKASKFKEDYIDAFNKMEQSLKYLDFSNPQTVLQLAQNWADEQKRRIDAENKIIKLQPKADFMDKVVETIQEKIDIGQAAKLLKLPYGRNTLFKVLKDMGIFFKNRNEPKQDYIDRGYFEMKEKFIDRNEHPRFMVMKVLVTQKGLVWLDKILGGNPSDCKIAKIV